MEHTDRFKKDKVAKTNVEQIPTQRPTSVSDNVLKIESKSNKPKETQSKTPVTVQHTTRRKKVKISKLIQIKEG